MMRLARSELGQMLRSQMRMTPVQRMISLWFSISDPQPFIDAINAHYKDRKPHRRLVMKVEKT